MADQSYSAPETIAQAKTPARKISRDREIDALKGGASRYEVPVDGARGLLVVVWPSGTKRFVLRYVSQSGERRRLPLGDHSKAFKLADAKKQADIHRATVAKDEDPAADRTKARRSARTGETLDELKDAYIKAARLGLHGGRQEPRRESSLDHDSIVYKAYIQPRLGKRRFNQIQKSDVLSFVRELLTERQLAASTVRGALAVLRGLLAFALFEEKIDSNA